MAGSAARVLAGGEVSVAVVPSGPAAVRTGTGPAGVLSSRCPGPRRSAQATAVAIVAWPQKGTSASGLK